MAFQVTITGTGIRRVLTWLVGVAGVVAAAWFLWHLLAGDDGVEPRIDRGGYQAVSLTSGQLYFGRLRDTGDGFVEVRDAHYIREVRGDDGSTQASEVVPTSNQLHAPRSRIVLSRSQIVTIENLSDDSPAVEAITNRDD